MAAVVALVPVVVVVAMAAVAPVVPVVARLRTALEATSHSQGRFSQALGSRPARRPTCTSASPHVLYTDHSWVLADRTASCACDIPCRTRRLYCAYEGVKVRQPRGQSAREEGPRDRGSVDARYRGALEMSS